MNNTNQNKISKKQTRAQRHNEAPEPKAKTIKLGIDVHLDRYVVVRIIDGGTPQPPQRFEPAEFLLWVARQLTLAEKVFTCYEAGPFGYSLHRGRGSDRRNALFWHLTIGPVPPRGGLCHANSDSSEESIQGRGQTGDLSPPVNSVGAGEPASVLTIETLLVIGSVKAKGLET